MTVNQSKTILSSPDVQVMLTVLSPLTRSTSSKVAGVIAHTAPGGGAHIGAVDFHRCAVIALIGAVHVNGQITVLSPATSGRLMVKSLATPAWAWAIWSPKATVENTQRSMSSVPCPAIR